MSYDLELADRVRAALDAHPAVREVRMFGGLAFMVNGAMVVGVGTAGDLLVRVDPRRSDEYLAVDGVSIAEMGEGRSMGRGWLAVDGGTVATDEDLAYWMGAALEFNRSARTKDP